MKKLFLTICLTAMLSTPAIAACEGGTLSNDGKFCICNMRLNWWSAANWCKANGMRLATMYEVCPDWNGNKGDGPCLPIADFGTGLYGWTATAYGSDEAFTYYIKDGYIGSSSRSSAYYAICGN